MTVLGAGLSALGLVPGRIEALAGDASQRRFFRVSLERGGTVVAVLYPEGQEAEAARDHGIQAWGAARGLPIPRPLGVHALVTVSEDVGDDDLARVAGARGEGIVALALEALAAFQGCDPSGLSTAPFDAAFFRGELAVFEEFALRGGGSQAPDVAAFLDELAGRVAAHPYRLVHRDFHVNNLFLRDGRVWALDFQDMRAGPDTYDLASLLRERDGARFAGSEGVWMQRAAASLAWPEGWERRYLECAAQRGLKVIGTFLRLAARGRTSYSRWLPGVRERAVDALARLGAPEALRGAAEGPRGGDP